MLKIVHIHVGMFDLETRLAALNETAAVHEVVLIGAHHLMAGGRLALLRQAVAPRQLIALLVGDDLPPIELNFIDELLNDGVIPVILALGNGPTAALMSWLENDERSESGAVPRREGHHAHGTPPLRQPRSAA